MKGKHSAYTLYRKRLVYEKLLDQNQKKIIPENIGTDMMKNNLLEVYKCYCFAKVRHLSYIEGTYSIQKERNPNATNDLNKTVLYKKKEI